MHHVPLYEPFNGNLTYEMLGVKTWLNESCGIPLEDMVGFRSPYLVQNPNTREVLYQNGAKIGRGVRNPGACGLQQQGRQPTGGTHTHTHDPAGCTVAGMLYDSSIIEYWPSQSSPSDSLKLWPYDMANGIPQVSRGDGSPSRVRVGLPALAARPAACQG